MSATGLAASDLVRGRESRRSCGRGAETATGLEAGPVLVAVWELPGLLIQVTTRGPVVPAAAGVWSSDAVITRR